MKQFWSAIGIGVLLLGALVAFATMPRLAGDPAAQGGGDTVTQGGGDTAVADLQACRTWELGRASSRLDRSLDNIIESLAFERASHDGGTEFYDWLDTDPVSQSLLAAADAAAAAGGTPGLSEPVFAAFRDVLAAATDLEESTVSGSVLVVVDVEADLASLSHGLGAVGDACG